MKRSNKWILGTAVAVLATSVCCQIIAKSPVILKGISTSAGTKITVTTVNQNQKLTLVVLRGGTPLPWPNNISPGGQGTATVILRAGISNVIYGYSNNTSTSICSFLFDATSGTVVGQPISPSATCVPTGGNTAVTLSVSS